MDPIAKLPKELLDRVSSAEPLWVGLFTYPWLDEVEAPEYERQPVTLDGTQEVLFNTDVARFPKALSDWGTIIGLAFYDARTSPTCDTLSSGKLTVSRQVCQDDVASFEPYSMVIQGEILKTIPWC